jgi:sarcosine oxidase subunit beta
VQETEVLIVGAGIAGASSAYYLARAGRRVVVLERGQVAGEASGVNMGGIDSLGWGNQPDLQAHLTHGSLELFKQLALDEGCDFEFRESGGLRAIQTPEHYDFARDRVLALRAAGYKVELLTTREARAIEPGFNPALHGAIYGPLRGQANPRKATAAFAQAAERAGARVLTGREVTAVEQRGDATWQVETPRDAFRAETLVLAAGAWCGPVGRLLGLEVPIVPVRGQMWATASLPPLVFQTIASAESAFDWARERERGAASGTPAQPPELTHRDGARVTRHLYGRQNRDGEIIFGGDRELVGYATAPDPAGIEANREQASQVLPLLRELPIARTWCGLMPFSLDGRPLIGRLPGRERLYIVSGLASSGFGRGPMAGKLLADLVHSGHPHPALAEANPARCVPPR